MESPDPSPSRNPPVRKKRSGLALYRRSRRKNGEGTTWRDERIRQEQVAAREESRRVRDAQADTATIAELRLNLESEKKQRKSSTKKLRKAEEDLIHSKAETTKAKSHCKKYCVTLPHLPRKDYGSLCGWRQKKLLDQFLVCFQELSTKFRLPDAATELAKKCVHMTEHH
jgi:hypothetical protein